MWMWMRRRALSGSSFYADIRCAQVTFLENAASLNATPTNVQLIGDEVAIAWSDGAETYYGGERLRAASPSADNQGERDIFGTQYGGRGPRSFPGVRVVGWEKVGNYAIRFDFSDGHRTGLYTFDYLRKLASPPP
jgi:DUF971 family protein